MPPSLDPAEAAQQLAGLQQTNAEMARRAVAPRWYHPALGGLAGMLIASNALSSGFRAAAFLLFFAGLVLLVQAYRRHTGLWVSGWRAGRTRWVSGTLGAVMLLVSLGSMVVAREHDFPAAYLIGGGIVAAACTIAGPLWETAFRRDLADGARP